jgi:hypothetical protein
MRLTRLAGACLMVAAIGAGAAAAAPSATRLVSTSGSDGSSTCTSSPCRTIGHAISVAGAGDTILVAAGTYAESVTIAKRLNLVGHNATLDATGHDNGIVVTGAGSAGTTIRGFTVTGAGLEGIFAVQTSKLVIAGNTLFGNDAYGPFAPQCVGNPDDCGEALHLQSVTQSTLLANSVHDNVGGILLTDEDGPTAHNVIVGNTVTNNKLDCGITLASHWFSMAGPAAPGVSGVYQNQVVNNTSNGNGAAGIGVFAGPPGAAAWGNIVANNTANGNGLPGVAIHSHLALQNANGNVVVGNSLSGNGPDDDAATPGPTGIAVFSDVTHAPIPGLPPASPILHTIVAANRISDEQIGIYTFGAPQVLGLPSNHFRNVTTPISVNE